EELFFNSSHGGTEKKSPCFRGKNNIIMSFNEKLADRTREIISLTHKNAEAKRMFGGLCFMVNDKMCVGVEKDRLMVRLDPAKYDEVMEKEGCHPMDFTGKIMKGYVFVDIDALTTKKKLEYWVNLALEFNKIAKSSKKKKK
ncbi:MAG TPA: TfoX/Sxy family protein, partial [Chitinophagaceae bacterium]|nr:TfoX/Sxy family protein [Chitinophagaceae bacterium]